MIKKYTLFMFEKLTRYSKLIKNLSKKKLLLATLKKSHLKLNAYFKFKTIYMIFKFKTHKFQLLINST